MLLRDGQMSIDMRCEVGLYMRPFKPNGLQLSSITLAGVDNNHWDWRFRVMSKSFFAMLFIARSGSNVTLSGVRIEDGGAHKPSLVALREIVGGPRNVLPMVNCQRGAKCYIKRYTKSN